MDITFVNHASVLITGKDWGILSDPWYFGTAFHEGWSLLYENPEAEIDDALSQTSHIWLSHEHPDHFSVLFFKKYAARLNDRAIPVIFRATRDGRVAGFLRANGIAVIEVRPDEAYQIGDARLRIVPSEFYDSALLLEAEGVRIFNLNDCPVRDARELAEFRAVYGPCDVLLTQFSYAAWKGGRNNRQWREDAAREKLDTVALQAKVLEAKAVIPFASFVRFSHDMNGYLNDAVNLPGAVAPRAGDSVRTVVMRPMERQSVDALKQDSESLAFWDAVFAGIGDMPKTAFRASVPLDDLQAGFRGYQARLFAANSACMIRLLKSTGLLGAFQPVVLRLVDLDRVVTVDITGGVFETPAAQPHADMHSASLDLIFKTDFGFDTLTVNGCFEETSPGGFQRLAKVFALGNLNNMGIHLTPRIALNANLILMFLGRLRKVAAKMA